MIEVKRMKEGIKKYAIYIIIGIVMIVSIIISYVPKEEEPYEVPITQGNPTIPSETYIYVDIRGSISNPGVYKLDQNTRLFQLIQKAGGLTEEADENKINQSIQLIDETFIYIPSIYDVDIVMKDDSSTQDDSSLININIASIAQLETLPGIGPATAQAIVDYREEVVMFQSIEEIMDVPGIGEATFYEIKDLITV
jgi:competence protein ComEA